MSDLLANVPASRLFDEMIKLLQTGHAISSVEELKKQGLVGAARGIFPILDVVLDDGKKHPERAKFVQMALADTDRRVSEDKPVAPSFMLACMLWHDVQLAAHQEGRRSAVPGPATSHRRRVRRPRG